MRDDGGPAFPVELRNHAQARAFGAPEFSAYQGMTLRDYFAAKVMQGLCANDGYNQHSPKVLANEAYGMADAMLEARNKEQ